jgi:hypothetical protein
VTLLLVVRRVHVYLGIFLLPWFVMFGVSSLLFNHPGWLGTGPAAAATPWTTLVDKPYDLDVPANADLRAIGRQVIADAGLSAGKGFGVGRPNPMRINVNLPSFGRPIRLSYFLDQHRLLAEQRAFVLGQALTGMHTRDGYYLQAGWQTAWGITIDIFCVVLVFWILSGLYMWWHLPSTRVWGWLAIAGGVASFATLMAKL